MSRRAAVPAAAKATWARRPASGSRKRTLRRRFCRQIKHEVGRQLALWRSVGHLDSLRDQNQSCCSTSRRSRKSTTDPLNMEHMRKQAGRKLAWARCYRYTSSSDQLRVALLKLQPASRRGEHGRRHTHTGIVCENMQGLGAKLRKLPGQAKICTPPGAGDACRV